MDSLAALAAKFNAPTSLRAARLDLALVISQRALQRTKHQLAIQTTMKEINANHVNVYRKQYVDAMDMQEYHKANSEAYQKMASDYRERYTQTLSANQELVAKVKQLRSQHTQSDAGETAHLKKQLENADATLKRALSANMRLKQDLVAAVGMLAQAAGSGLNDNALVDRMKRELHGYICVPHAQSIHEPHLNTDLLANSKPYIHPFAPQES